MANVIKDQDVPFESGCLVVNKLFHSFLTFKNLPYSLLREYFIRFIIVMVTISLIGLIGYLVFKYIIQIFVTIFFVALIMLMINTVFDL